MKFIHKAVGIDTYIRGKKNEFGYEVWSVSDFINAVGGYDTACGFGNDLFSDYTKMEHEHFCEVMPYVSYARFAGFLNMFYYIL